MNKPYLTRTDVKNLADTPSVANKQLIARKLGACYNDEIPQQIAKLVEDIFRIMVRDTEIKVREVLADSLKHCQNLPDDVVTSIINDKDCVAIPFLQHYSSLTAEDFIKILNMPAISRHKAIASRPDLSPEVLQYIAEHCADEVVFELISNQQAALSEPVYNTIIHRYPDNTEVHKRLVYRSELPVSIIEKIVDKLSYYLKTYLVLHHNLPKDLVSNLVEEVKEKITLNISEEYSSDKQIEELVHQLYRANRLTSGMVVRAICLGDLLFFEYALVYLSETPIAEVRKILFDTQTEFMVRNLLRKAFIPKTAFPAIFSALKVIREIRFDCGRSNRKAFGHKVVERILSLTQNNDELSSDDISYLVSKIN